MWKLNKMLIKLIKISSFYFIQYLIAKQWGNIEALFLLIFIRSHQFEKFGSIEVSGYASLLKPLAKWNTFQFVICCGSKNTEQQIIVFTVPAYWQLSRRLMYKGAGFYWGDHSKLTSLPEFRLSMLFSLFSIFIALIFLDSKLSSHISLRCFTPNMDPTIQAELERQQSTMLEKLSSIGQQVGIYEETAGGVFKHANERTKENTPHWTSHL